MYNRRDEPPYFESESELDHFLESGFADPPPTTHSPHQENQTVDTFSYLGLPPPHPLDENVNHDANENKLIVDSQIPSKSKKKTVTLSMKLNYIYYKDRADHTYTEQVPKKDLQSAAWKGRDGQYYVNNRPITKLTLKTPVKLQGETEEVTWAAVVRRSYGYADGDQTSINREDLRKNSFINKGELFVYDRLVIWKGSVRLQPKNDQNDNPTLMMTKLNVNDLGTFSYPVGLSPSHPLYESANQDANEKTVTLDMCSPHIYRDTDHTEQVTNKDLQSALRADNGQWSVNGRPITPLVRQTRVKLRNEWKVTWDAITKRKYIYAKDKTEVDKSDLKEKFFIDKGGILLVNDEPVIWLQAQRKGKTKAVTQNNTPTPTRGVPYANKSHTNVYGYQRMNLFSRGKRPRQETKDESQNVKRRKTVGSNVPTT